MSAAIDANAANLELLVNLFKCLRLICRIFFSLNSQELPEVFEIHGKTKARTFGLSEASKYKS